MKFSEIINTYVLINVLILFILMNIGLIVLFYNGLIGLDLHILELIYGTVPVLSASILLTISLPIILLVAVVTSRRGFQDYQQRIIGYIFMVSFLIFFIMIPDKLNAPELLGFNMMSSILTILASQLFVSKCLALNFWKAVGKE